MIDATALIELIGKHFPEIVDELQDETWKGLLHVQTGVFSHYAQRAIDQQDQVAWRKITGVFVLVWDDCSADVTNALNVSFLEHLKFSDQKAQRSWAYKAMPVKMRRAWDEMEDYNKRIHGG
jgi:hypothetical protein